MAMDNQVIERRAIGRIANFGDIYDARKDCFCSLSIFNNKIPDSFLKDSTDSTYMLERFVENDTFSEKFAKMDVYPDLQISILNKLTSEMKNSGQFLVTHKKSAREVKCSVVSIVKQRDQMLDYGCDRLSGFLRTNPKEMANGTHIVVGISYGASCVISLSFRCDDQTKYVQQQRILSSHVKKFLGKNNIEPVNTDEYLSKMLSRVTVTTFSDVMQENIYPRKFDDAIKFLKAFPQLALTNSKQLVYKLVPISVFFNEIKIHISCPAVYHELHTPFAPRIVELFERMILAKQEVHDYLQDVTKFNYCVQETHLNEVLALQNNLTSYQTSFQQKLAQVITAIRSGTQHEKHEKELDALIGTYYKNGYSLQKMWKNDPLWKTAQHKIEFAKQIRSEEAQYLGRGHNLTHNYFMESKYQSVVFYFSDHSKSQHPELWKDNLHIFFERLKTKSANVKYYAVDCDFHEGLKPKPKNTCINVYKNHKIVVNDMLAYQDREHSQYVPWVQLLSDPDVSFIEPKRLGPLTVICPCESQGINVMKNWHCTICCTPVTYGFDKMLYCECGRTPIEYAEFKCQSSLHGKFFQRHEAKELAKYLEQTLPFSETNLLILGETGVGKSTWINSFVNFLTYESLSEAETGGLRTLIPSQFTFYDKNFQSTNVCTGVSENEMFEDGQSATQQSKVYKFQIGTGFIRLIDTPGIGDTRGIDKDKENFQNILQTIANIHDLHGICILLKPNNARISVVFRFCIKELLANLHRDATRNIVFCFTNSRETFYRPGDTMPALQALLQENRNVQIVTNQQTVYCFDSEAYRFLAAVVNDPPVEFEEYHRSNFENSWKQSMAETKRMLSHINSLKPHKTTSTLNLNHARELVLSLTRPLAEISRNIHTNRGIWEQELEEIEHTEANIEDLKKRRYTTVSEMKLVPLFFPRTVCASRECVTLTTIGDRQTQEYSTICHPRCKLDGVTADAIGHPLLMKCVVFSKSSGNQCEKCQHPYNEHLHIYYESLLIPVEVEDQSVKDALDKDLSAAQLKKNMINDRKAKIEKFEEELKEIEKASVKFACFLKRNAITPYNDGMEQYLNYLIREEKEKVAQNANPQVLERLKCSLRSYMKERQILEEAMEKGGDKVNVISPADVEELVNKLKQLKVSGDHLEKALEFVGKTRAAVFQEVQLQKCIRTKNKNILSWAAKTFHSTNDKLQASDITSGVKDVCI